MFPSSVENFERTDAGEKRPPHVTPSEATSGTTTGSVGDGWGAGTVGSGAGAGAGEGVGVGEGDGDPPDPPEPPDDRRDERACSSACVAWLSRSAATACAYAMSSAAPVPPLF